VQPRAELADVRRVGAKRQGAHVAAGEGLHVAAERRLQGEGGWQGPHGGRGRLLGLLGRGKLPLGACCCWVGSCRHKSFVPPFWLVVPLWQIPAARVNGEGWPKPVPITGAYDDYMDPTWGAVKAQC